MHCYRRIMVWSHYAESPQCSARPKLLYRGHQYKTFQANLEL